MIFSILALGDVVGQSALLRVTKEISAIRREYNIDFVIVNGENAAPNNGIDKKSAEELLAAEIDVVTTGNHVFRHRSIRDVLDERNDILRPANFPAAVPGSGYTIINCGGVRILVMNVLGVIYLEPLADPFRTVEQILSREEGHYDISVLDIHAEATSEKIALSHYFEGRISAVFGTHTHVQTADETILPGGTGYITDLGMCGPLHSVLGVKTECIIEKLTTHLPVKFEVSENEIELRGAVFRIDTDTGRCVEVFRIIR